MSGFRLAREAEDQLDDIWLRVARDSGSIEIANRFIDRLTECFWLLGRHPFMGRRRDDLRDGLRSFPLGDYVIVHRVEVDETVLILYVFHGHQDLEAFLRQ